MDNAPPGGLSGFPSLSADGLRLFFFMKPKIAMSVKIYHNPRCSKSRQTLELIRARGIEPDIVDYLKTPPETAELKRIIARLGVEVRDIMRSGEAVYKELDLARPELSDRSEEHTSELQSR